MRETYVLIGHEMSWTAALPVLAIGGLSLFLSRRKPTRNALAWQFLVILLEIAACVVANLPSEWLVGAFCLPVGLSMIGRTAGPGNRKMRIASGFGILAIGVGASFFLSNMVRSKIVLTDSSVIYDQWDGSDGAAQRKGLRVHATAGSRGWWTTRNWYSWTTFTSIDQLGPDLAGFDLYWGPHGIIRGDVLGRRLASWADTTPNYRTYQ